MDDPVFVLLAQLVPRRVARNAFGFGVTHQVVLRFDPRRRLNGFDGARPQGKFVVWNHQTIVHTNHAAKASAGVAGAHGRVKREHGRYGVAVAQVAVGAMQAGGEAPQFGRRFGIQRPVNIQSATTAFDGQLNRFHHTGLFSVAELESVSHHVEHFARPCGRSHLTFGMDACEAAGTEPLLHLSSCGVGGQLHGEGHDETRILRLNSTAALQLSVNALRRVMLHGLGGLTVKQVTRARDQQLQMIIQLRHRAHGGTRAAHGVALVDRNCGGHPFDLVYRGAVHAV